MTQRPYLFGLFPIINILGQICKIVELELQGRCLCGTDMASVVIIFYTLPKMVVDYGQWQATECVEDGEDSIAELAGFLDEGGLPHG